MTKLFTAYRVLALVVGVLLVVGALGSLCKYLLADGSKLIFVRDPWGVPVQLCQRAKPFPGF